MKFIKLNYLMLFLLFSKIQTRMISGSTSSSQPTTNNNDNYNNNSNYNSNINNGNYNNQNMNNNNYNIYENDVFIKSTNDMDYATYFILTNKNSYYIIYSYLNNTESSIPEGTIKICNNKVIKI